MTTARTSPASNQGHAWRTRRHWRGAYGAAPEVSPVAPVDRRGHRRGSGRHHDDGCFLCDTSDRLSDQGMVV
jgi:hypothetical protein